MSSIFTKLELLSMASLTERCTFNNGRHLDVVFTAWDWDSRFTN